MEKITDKVLSELNKAISQEDWFIVAEIKSKYWIQDLYDYETEKREAYNIALGYR
jgi:hypothetical protein